MTLFRTSALFIGLGLLAVACGSDSSSSPDAPIISNGGSRGDAAVVPGTGGVTGTGGATITPSVGGAIGGVDSGAGGAGGAGGSPVGIDASAGGTTGGLDSGAGGSVGIDSGIDGGTAPTVKFTKEQSLLIINAATTGGLDVTGPTAVPYTTCK
jgi:hypothetical protein